MFDEKTLNTAREYESSIMSDIRTAEEAAKRSLWVDAKVVVWMSYELYCDMLFKVDAIGGEVGGERTFHGYPIRIYSGGSREKSYEVHIKTEKKIFEI